MSFPKSHCLGCGVNMASKKPYERRVLCSVAGEQVRDSWKEVMLAKLAMCELDLDLDKMIVNQVTCAVYALRNPRQGHIAETLSVSCTCR